MTKYPSARRRPCSPALSSSSSLKGWVALRSSCAGSSGPSTYKVSIEDALIVTTSLADVFATHGELPVLKTAGILPCAIIAVLVDVVAKRGRGPGRRAPGAELWRLAGWTDLFNPNLCTHHSFILYALCLLSLMI